MSNEIKACFQSYVNFMTSTQLKKIDTVCPEEIQLMTNSQIGSELDLIHMQYILLSPFSVSKTTPAYVAYKHLKEMIDTGDINKKCIQLEIDLASAKAENDLLRSELADLKSKMPEIVSVPVVSVPVVPVTDTDPVVRSRSWFGR